MLIRGLAEIPIVHADRKEPIGALETNDLVCVRTEVGKSFAWCDWHCKNKTAWLCPCERFQYGFHGPAGRDAVVDHNDRAAGDFCRRVTIAVKAPAAFDFGKLAGGLCFQVGRARLDLANDIFIEHNLRICAVDNRAQPKKTVSLSTTSSDKGDDRNCRNQRDACCVT